MNSLDQDDNDHHEEDYTFRQPHHRHRVASPRGILNVTGTACHVSSALQVLRYGLAPLALALMKSSEHHHEEKPRLEHLDQPEEKEEEEEWLHELGSFLAQLDSPPTPSGPTEVHHHDLLETTPPGRAPDPDATSHDEALDPTRLWNSLQEHVAGWPTHHDVGDAISALVRLLQALRSTSSSSGGLGKHIMDHLDTGLSYSVLQGYPTDTGVTSSTTPSCVKRTPSRPLSNPFPLRLDMSLPDRLHLEDQPSATITNDEDAQEDQHTLFHLQDLLRQMLQPQLVRGYQWPRASSSSPSAETRITTTKTLHIERLPLIWMLQLPLLLASTLHHRCRHYHDDGHQAETTQPAPSSLVIPSQLNVQQFITSSSPTSDDSSQMTTPPLMYHLLGGIVHIAPPLVEINQHFPDHDHHDESTTGHYGALITVPTSSRTGRRHWYWCDDEFCHLVSQSTALQWLGGTTWTEDGPGNNSRSSLQSGSRVQGVLLIYAHPDASGLAKSFD